MKSLVFCTNNDHKLMEVATILGMGFKFLTLIDIDFFDPIPEPYNTLEENSLTKANQVYQSKGCDCFAEDTGLFIEALCGEPGVFSARYAGETSSASENIEKVLMNMKHITNRKAYFKTIVTLILDGQVHQFSGICDGSISNQKSGQSGFGYDPIFIPEGYSVSFADLNADEKNLISHRRKAFDQMLSFLKLKFL